MERKKTETAKRKPRGGNRAPNAFKSRAVELKPREKIEQAGSAAVATPAELLAVILKTGTAGCDVAELANRLIDAFGGVRSLVKSDLNTLRNGIAAYNKTHPSRRIAGMGRVKILELAAAFELARRGYAADASSGAALSTSALAAETFRAAMRERPGKESFWVLPVDVKNRPLSVPQTVAVGTVSGVNIHPRDVFSAAVKWNAYAVIVAHNHPSGCTEPSKKDAELTASLCKAGEMMGIPLLDHIIVSETSHYSFAAAGTIHGPRGRK